MAKGSVYYHFQGKDQLLVAVIQEGVLLIRDTIDARTVGVEDRMERLLLALGAIYDVLVDYHGIARFALLGGCEGVSREARERIEAAREQFEADLEARVREIAGDAGDARVLARIVFGALVGAVRAAGIGRGARRSRERVKSVFLGICSRALESRVSS